MITTNIHDAKTNFSKYVALAAKGEKVIICRNNVPVVEMASTNKKAEKDIIIGRYKDQFEIGDEFFEPLPDDLLALFNGEDE